nr:putative zinc finger, CCHC-type [Tanacetum cinerariifolium]
MLDRTDFASWQQQIRLYCRGKENRVNILKSIDEWPYKMGTFRETLAESTEETPQFGPERPRVYSDLNFEEKDWYNADNQATNILLQGLPKDIYTFINHYTNAKDIWDNVKMLLEGSELTKEDRESQLYDNFKHFRQHNEESIHEYYVRFPKLINDMRNIKMTMSKLQLNSKFVNNMLPEWGRYVKTVKLSRGLRDSNYDQQYAYLKQHETHAKENKMKLERFSQPTVDPLALLSNVSNPQHHSPSSGQGMNPQGRNAAGYGGATNRVGNDNQSKARLGQARTAQENGVALDAEQLLFIVGGQDNVFDDDVDEQPVQDLALNVDNVFQADYCDAFDSDVDEAPTTQTMFMANLSSADPVTDEAEPSYNSDILSKVPDYEHYLDATCIHHEGHYVRDNDVPVVHSGASSVPTDAFMMIYNDMYESPDPSISHTSRNTVVKNSLTAELATYKEHIKLELHSIKLQLASTINHNKLMAEEVSFLKKDIKQKENKHLADFLNMKTLKEKVEDKLIKQEQSLQTVHMLCRQRTNSNELNRVVIGYKNPLCLTRAKQVQPALYNGHEIIKDNQTSAIVHNSEDTREIAKITRKKMNDKMNDPECVTRKVKIAPHDYSKENLLATFTPQKQLTPEQIFWSNDLMKLKSEDLKERTKVSRAI